ncbi:hypothetical protein FQZ97_753520 [compost metagenome]
MHQAEADAGATGEVEWQQVLVPRMVACRMGRQAAIVVQGGFVVGLQVRCHPVSKLLGPGCDHVRAGAPVQFAQVVGDAAGADQQDAALAQAGQGSADASLESRAEAGGQ